MPALRTRREGDRLWIELSSPGSAVNVFGHGPAAELRAILEALPDDVAQVVLRSQKPGSFINGAGLLYANSMRSPTAAREISAEVRATYQLLAACPAQTVAVIEGNCFGCGLELALCCDARVARDCAEAQFRMTELVDYRFVPLFGGTWRLPRLVGEERAKRLLLDGESWTAAQARRARLVDAVLEGRGFERALRDQLDRWRGREVSRSAPPRGRSKVRAVPPGRTALWEVTEALVDQARSSSDEAALREELSAFAASVTSPEAKAAMRFFFVRHMARAASWSRTERTPPQVRLVPARADRSALARSLGSRRPLWGGESVRTLRSTSARGARVGAVELLFPRGADGRLCELRTRPATLQQGRDVARALDWLGYEPVLTFGDSFVAERLLRATRTTVQLLRRKGYSREALAAALWDFGFASPVPGVGRRRARRGAPGTVETLLAAWREVLAKAREDGSLVHPSQGEVLVQELFEFPLERGTVAAIRMEVAAAAAAAEAFR